MDTTVSPDGTQVYVTNHDDNTVAVIDPFANAVAAVVPVGEGPTGAAVKP
jgi:YVTN family beta-propeller protein